MLVVVVQVTPNEQVYEKAKKQRYTENMIYQIMGKRERRQRKILLNK